MIHWYLLCGSSIGNWNLVMMWAVVPWYIVVSVMWALWYIDDARNWLMSGIVIGRPIRIDGKNEVAWWRIDTMMLWYVLIVADDCDDDDDCAACSAGACRLPFTRFNLALTLATLPRLALLRACLLMIYEITEDDLVWWGKWPLMKYWPEIESNDTTIRYCWCAFWWYWNDDTMVIMMMMPKWRRTCYSDKCVIRYNYGNPFWNTSGIVIAVWRLTGKWWLCWALLWPSCDWCYWNLWRWNCYSHWRYRGRYLLLTLPVLNYWKPWWWVFKLWWRYCVVLQYDYSPSVTDLIDSIDDTPFWYRQYSSVIRYCDPIIDMTDVEISLVMCIIEGKFDGEVRLYSDWYIVHSWKWPLLLFWCWRNYRRWLLTVMTSDQWNCIGIGIEVVVLVMTDDDYCGRYFVILL